MNSCEGLISARINTGINSSERPIVARTNKGMNSCEGQMLGRIMELTTLKGKFFQE
jgi:hypothetical protein